MPEIIPNYHPIMVHFTIALMVTSLGVLLLSYIFKMKPNLHRECLIVSRWCLWLAALASILTVMAGFHAYYTVGHDMVSHKVMMIHRNWGIATFIVIWFSAIWSFLLYLKEKPPRWLFTLLLVIAVMMVMITGWYGAELVFRYGLGVKSLPQVETSGHQHVTGKQENLPKIKENSHANHEH